MADLADLTTTDKGPWWNKTLWVVGPTAIIALGLVWAIVTGKLVFNRTDVDTAIVGAVGAMKENLSLHHANQQETDRRIEQYMDIQNKLTRQLCVNAARNEPDRSACFKP